jgi:tRNA(Arg) A34 adenosine deaminase TadA
MSNKIRAATKCSVASTQHGLKNRTCFFARSLPRWMGISALAHAVLCAASAKRGLHLADLSNLHVYLNRPVSDLVAAPVVDLPPAQKERHRIYSLLLMACTRYYWNGMQRGHGPAYPLNPSSAAGDTAPFLDGAYLGHNIASLGVDGDGYVMDFDFNHNELFNSSAEHAESRLVRRLFALTQIHDSWNVGAASQPPQRYGNLLKEVTVYTTLESCSQCSGVMALGQVKAVVFLQDDPGMYHIGNMLRRLTEHTELQAPLPIPGNAIGLPYFELLNQAFDKFAAQQKSKKGDPFFAPRGGHPEYSPSITSFLCTRQAYAIFLEAERQFESHPNELLKFPEYKPTPSALTNAAALAEASSFHNYATRKGRRGTPHH